MNRTTSRRASIAAAAIVAGLVLGAGGLTIANWSASTSVGAGTINTGDLNLEAPATGVTWQDITTPDKERTFLPGTDKLIPGQTIKRVQPVKVTLIGERAAAKFELATGAATKTQIGDEATVSYELLKTGDDKSALKTMTDGALNVVFANPRAVAATDDVVVDGTATYNLVTTITLNANERTGTNASVTLDNTTLTLTQEPVREVK